LAHDAGAGEVLFGKVACVEIFGGTRRGKEGTEAHNELELCRGAGNVKCWGFSRVEVGSGDGLRLNVFLFCRAFAGVK